MTDWSDVGRQMEQKYQDDVANAVAKSEAMNKRILRDPFFQFWDDVRRFANDRLPSPFVVSLLKSDKPLDGRYRECLALLFEGKYIRTRGRGRSRNKDLHNAVGDAEFFYRSWRKLNRDLGVSDRGHADAMKDECVRMAITYQSSSLSEENSEAVRELWARPKKRHK